MNDALFGWTYLLSRSGQSHTARHTKRMLASGRDSGRLANPEIDGVLPRGQSTLIFVECSVSSAMCFVSSALRMSFLMQALNHDCLSRQCARGGDVAGMAAIRLGRLIGVGKSPPSCLDENP